MVSMVVVLIILVMDFKVLVLAWVVVLVSGIVVPLWW